MNKSILTGLIVGLGSLAWVSGTAIAGSGCDYGLHKAQSPVENVDPVAEGTDPRLLARLKAEQAEKVGEVRTEVMPVPGVHN